MQSEIVVIIGAGGMGEAIARRVGSGRQLVIADYNEALVERVVRSFEAEGFPAIGHPVDVASRGSLSTLASAVAALGTVKTVVHTAGLSPAQASKEAILQVDLAGVAYSLEVFGAVIAPGGAGIVISSMAGSMAAGQLRPDFEHALATAPSDELLRLPFLAPEAIPDAGAAYGIAKRANQVRVQFASNSWGARGARVNSISPGVISTPMGKEELAGSAGEFMRSIVAASGTGRIGNASDIANAAAFLLCNEASFITGTDLLVDGGVVAGFRSGVIDMPAV